MSGPHNSHRRDGMAASTRAGSGMAGMRLPARRVAMMLGGSAALALALVATLFSVSAPAADAYPAKQPIRLVVPFAAGGGTDIIARVLGAGMSADLHQTVIIDNKAGAGTVIGSDFVAKAPADGYTLLIATFAHAVNPSLQPSMPYNTATAFAPVMLIGRSPNVLVVKPERPFHTVADVIAYAKANPGKLTYGSFGNGTSAHLAAELFKNLAHVDMTHVPYKGSSPAITDLLGGQIDLMFTTVSSVSNYIASGKLRAIAVTSPKRSPAMASIPTIAEAGVPGYVAESWYGIFAPAGTPRPIIDRLNASLRKAVASDAFRKRIEDEGLLVTPSPPEALASYVAAEQVRWAKVVDAAHIKAD